MIHRKKWHLDSDAIIRQSVRHTEDLELHKKKTLCYKEQNPEKVKEYQEKIKDIPEKNCIC